jgi:2-isopropylmalate synthase
MAPEAKHPSKVGAPSPSSKTPSSKTPPDKSPPRDRVLIFDTTLRDGEQSPGASMNLDEKLRIAEQLEALGVDIIEAGFPIASNGDFEAVQEISKLLKGTIICGLARAGRKDIDRAWEALKPAKRGRIHTFISTSALHMKYKLQMTPDQVHEAVVESVSHARKLCDDVEWSCEDGTRSDRDFLCRLIETAIKCGATTINIPDTVGYTLPEEYTALIHEIRNRVTNIDRARISTHCHNDLGLAVANSLAGVMAGARQVECTINGLGERAGNAAMEEIVMAIRTRADLLHFDTGIRTQEIMKASRLVSSVTGFLVQNNKAVVGANAFAHESGIHQDGMLKHAGTYEIMTPESIGLSQSTLVMGKHSGRHALKARLKDLGFEFGENQLTEVFGRFKDLADRKKEIFDEDLVALADDTTWGGQERIRFVSLAVVAGSKGPQTADLELKVDGEAKAAHATGNGPVDAAFNAIKQILPHEGRLLLYQVHAVTAGTDAQAEVTVRLEEKGKSVQGHAADADTMVASVRAYVSALNKLLVKREKTAPAALSA